MIANKIIISKDEILNKYSNLDAKVKVIIEKLYEIKEFNKEYTLLINVNIKAFKVDESFLDNIKSNNELKKYENKTGVYIFLKDNIPVYIGFSGQKDKEQSLYGRIVNKQLSTNDNLVKKIKKIEKLLNPNLTLLEDRKKLVLEYTSSLIVIDFGKQETNNIKFAQALEVILIALFNSKYNG